MAVNRPFVASLKNPMNPKVERSNWSFRTAQIPRNRVALKWLGVPIH